METLRFAFRSLRKTPGFTAVAVLALTLGIGANSAIFSLVEAIFLQPLPYAHPERLVLLSSAIPERELTQLGFSWPRLQAVRESQKLFSDISVSTFNGFTVTGGGDPELVQGQMVSANYFSLLGVKPVLGRTFLADEDKPGGANVVLLSHDYWQSHYNGRRDVLGQPITLDGRIHTIVGVLPRSLSGFPLNQMKLFVPRPFEAPFLVQKQIDDGGFFFNVVGRLAPGVELAQVRAAMNVIAASYAKANPANVDATSTITAGTLLDELVGNQRLTYGTLFAAVAAVLLIACANVANLVLSRFSRRRKEISVRIAMGARRRHVVAQFVAESLMLSLAGGALGLLLAAVSLGVVARVGANLIPRADAIGLDPTIVAFTLVVSLGTGLAIGLLTALQTPMQAVNDALRESSRGSTSDRGRHRFRAVLLVGEIAASFVLLIVTGLLISSFARIRDVEPGFRPDGVFVGFINMPDQKYPYRSEALANFYSTLYHRLQAIPGVKAVALSDNPPLSGNNGLSPYAVVGRPLPPPSERPLAVRNLISPNRFALLGIPLRAGRDFDEHDTPTSEQVIIINEAMAKALFRDQDPVGQKLVTGMLGLTAQIVGVVADTHTQNLTTPPAPEMYYPALQRPESFTGILVRTAGEPAALTATVRAALRDVDPAIPLTNPTTLQQLVDQSMADRRLVMNLLMVFAGLALLLASIGVYSVMAYSVSQRFAEIGIRMALGARAGDVQRMVLLQGMKLTGAGVAIGLVAAVVATRLMRALLFDYGASDLLVPVGIGALLALVAALACWIPSRRAASVDPVHALYVA